MSIERAPLIGSPEISSQADEATWQARMISVRRDLHRHPELAWQERRSSRKVCEWLEELGLEPRLIAETGVIADLPGDDRIPRVALRADIDALPIHEETGLPFASKNDGVMHACGHDGHTAMVLGAAELLLDRERPAPVRLIFQPAEEIVTGARKLMSAGALDGVGLIFGAHLDLYFETGQLVVTEGAVNASSDRFNIRLTSRGAHAARPHESPDSVVAGSQIVMALQTIVSRQIDPAFPAVVTVGTFEAGTTHNVLADQALLSGTIRALDPDVRRQLAEAVKHTARSVSDLCGTELEFELEEGTPPLINSEGPLELARAAAETVVGRSRIEAMRKANLGGEDFAFYLEQVPGCYIRVGARRAEQPLFAAHTSRFDFDEAALEVGARWFSEVACVAGDALRQGEFF